MTNITLYEDTQKYINMFYTPVISSYEFLKSFFAELYQLGEHEVSRDLSEFFCDLKKNPKYNEVLYEIKFRSNGIFNYSNELEDNILMLQEVTEILFNVPPSRREVSEKKKTDVLTLI